MLGGSPSLTTTATIDSPVGTYAIVAGPGSLAAANYSFSFGNGTLNVTAATATIASPAKGSTLSDSTVTFAWTKESGATGYQLWAGSTAGSYDVGYRTTSTLSVTTPVLPTDGRTLYVTLYGYAGGVWSVQDTATYIAGP